MKKITIVPEPDSTAHSNESLCKECRICLEGSQPNDSNNKLIKPCNCFGSIKYVHQKCMIKWIEATLKTKDYEETQTIMATGIDCQICKTLITFESKRKRHCRKTDSICIAIQAKCQLFALTLLIVFMCLAGIAALSYAEKEIMIKFDQKALDIVFPILAFLGLMLFLCFMGLGFYLLSAHFLIEETVHVIRIHSSKNVEITQLKLVNEQRFPIDNTVQLFQPFQ